MKKIILLISALVLVIGLTAYRYTSISTPPDIGIKCQKSSIKAPPILNYKLSSYCSNTITKQTLKSAQSIKDIIPDYTFQLKLSHGDITVRDITIGEGEVGSAAIHRVSKTGIGNNLNSAQWELLKSMDYSKILSVEGYYTVSKSGEDQLNDRYFSYCMTIVPEKEAVYFDGKKSILDYLESNSRATIQGEQDGFLESGNISITVSKTGIIDDIFLLSSCGYGSIDEKMIQLLKQLPGSWKAATDSRGEKVDQTFIFSYGKMGC